MSVECPGAKTHHLNNSTKDACCLAHSHMVILKMYKNATPMVRYCWNQHLKIRKYVPGLSDTHFVLKYDNFR